MNKELIMKSDVLDILFENRNKSYGAYQLRKFYTNRLFKALGIMLTIVVVLSAFTFLPKKRETLMATIFEIPPTVLANPKEPQKKPEMPKEPAKAIQPDQKRSTGIPDIVADRFVKDSVKTLKPSDVIRTVTITHPGNGGPGPVTPGIIGGGAIDPLSGGVKTTVDNNTPVNTADIMPGYPGGMEALRRFLQKNLNNPKDMEQGELVSVKIKFVVGYNGKLKGFETIEDGGPEFNNEVIRVLKKMPEWIPGRTNGETVSVYYTLPVKFIPAE